MSNEVIYSPEELRVSTEQSRPTESVSKREYELIQELIKLRKDKNIYLEYEYLDDSVPVPYTPPFGRYLFTAIGITLAVAVGAVVLAVVLKKKK